MAITKLDVPGDASATDAIAVKVDNGDYEALQKIVAALNFSSPENALRFAIAVLIKAGARGVYVDENGNKVRLTPGENLLNRPSPPKG